MIFSEGMRIKYFGENAQIEAIKPEFAVITFENKAATMLTPKQLNHAFKIGQLIVKKRENAVLMQGLTLPEDIKAAELLEPFLIELHNQAHKNSLATALKVIARVCKKNNISPDDAPSGTTLRRKYKVYVEQELDIAAVIKMPIKARAPRLDKSVIKITEKCIYDLYLQRNGLKASQVLKTIISECANAGLSDKCISSSQFYNMIKKLDPLEVIRCRQGHDAARRLARESGGKYVLDFPLQRVEIDAVHTKVGLLCDGTLKFIGVPIIYIAIDTYTRCIIAYVISYGESPSELSSAVTELIKKCVSPKSKSPKAMNDWPLTGIPYAIFGDAGSAFVAKEVTLLMAQLNTHYITTETKSPWKKPFVESFNRTIRGQFCDSMPGYMRHDEEKNYDQTIQNMATVTITEFIDALDVFILDHYHQNPHSGLYGDTPANYCEKALENFAPKMIQDMSMLKVIKGSEDEGAIQPSKGIQKNGVFYSSPQLQKLGRELATTKKSRSPKVTYFYDKNDISEITVINDLDATMFQVSAKNQNVRGGMSLKEFKSGLPEKITKNMHFPFTPFNKVLTGPNERKDRLMREKREAAELRKAEAKKKEKAALASQEPSGMGEHIDKNKSRFGQNHTDKSIVTERRSHDDWERPVDFFDTE